MSIPSAVRRVARLLQATGYKIVFAESCTGGLVSGALTAIPGIVFSGGWDGILRALSAVDGKIVWQYNTIQEFTTVNGVAGRGGAINGPGPTAAGGMLWYFNSETNRAICA